MWGGGGSIAFVEPWVCRLSLKTRPCVARANPEIQRSRDRGSRRKALSILESLGHPDRPTPSFNRSVNDRLNVQLGAASDASGPINFSFRRPQTLRRRRCVREERAMAIDCRWGRWPTESVCLVRQRGGPLILGPRPTIKRDRAFHSAPIWTNRGWPAYNWRRVVCGKIEAGVLAFFGPSAHPILRRCLFLLAR